MIYNDFRRKTRKVKVGDICIGGDAPISVQTMANKDSSDIEALYRQVNYTYISNIFIDEKLTLSAYF